MLFQSLLWALSLSSFVAGQYAGPTDPNNHWDSSFPGLPGPKSEQNISVYASNVVWENNSTQHLRWAAQFPVNISCYQQGPHTNRLYVYADPNTTDSKQWLNNIYWNVSIPYEWFTNGDGNVFYFAVYNDSAGPGSPPAFLSHYFNVTQPTKSASSSSNAVAIGAGVGGGVGGALLLAAIAYGIYYMRKRSKKQQQQQKDATAEAGAVSDHVELPSPSPNEKYGQFIDHAGQYAPTQYDSHYGGSPVGSPAPAYKPGYEVSQELGHDNPHDAAHELDSTVNRH